MAVTQDPNPDKLKQLESLDSTTLRQLLTMQDRGLGCARAEAAELRAELQTLQAQSTRPLTMCVNWDAMALQTSISVLSIQCCWSFTRSQYFLPSRPKITEVSVAPKSQMAQFPSRSASGSARDSARKPSAAP